MKSLFPGRSLLLVVVAALGYFVDIYDLVLFNVVKRESLEAIMGVGHPGITEMGVDLFNIQMLGMLLGGILWGVWGDKKGRLTVLFGSILLYSAANNCSAPPRSTLTNRDTPCSTMVTPNSRCMRLMVTALWVTIR